MKGNSVLKNIAVSFAAVQLACSTTPPNFYKEIQADPIGLSSTKNESQPNGFINDAMIVEQAPFFPDQVYAKMGETLNSDKELSTKLRDVQALICNGKAPRFTPSYSVHLIVPKVPWGLAIDVAAEMKTKTITTNRNFIRSEFLNKVSDSIGDNPSFKHYKEYIVENSSDQAHWNGSGYDTPILLLPFMPSNNMNKIAESFAARRIQPQDHFLSLVFPKDRTALLVPRVIDAVNAQWILSNYGSWHYEAPKVDIVGANLNNEFYVVSNNGWRLKGHEKIGAVFPLHATQFSDLAFIKANYTFALPKDVICKISAHGGGKVDCRDEDEMTKHRYNDRDWGYDVKNSISKTGSPVVEELFSPTLALNQRTFMWERIFQSQTSVKEAAQPDESIRFELSLNMGLFCQYGTPITELQSR